jgi:hypothetical protein
MLSQFQYFPDEIVRNIYEYMPYQVLTWLSKTYYDKYHTTTIQTHIKNTGKKLDTYFRYIIRLDNHIALQDMLNNSKIIKDVKTHNHNHNLKYKNKKYANIVDFLLYLSIENYKPSTKCKNVLIEYVKNKHKNKM